jgi:hypothetical protein
VRAAMIQHLEKFGILSQHQHGFVKGRSCVTNLLETMDVITSALNKLLDVIVIYLDLAKAFDSVLHSALMVKLEALQFDKQLCAWILDFLTDRKQRVVLDGFMSNWRRVGRGVPQGSVLGPLLFLVFINDMPAGLNHICKLYADDSKLIAVIKTDEDRLKLQEDLDKVCDWSAKWKIGFNVAKCKVMHFKSKLRKTQPHTRDYTMNINGQRVPLSTTQSERDLGIQVTNKLKWAEQVSIVTTKANSMMGRLKRAFKYWTPFVFKKLYCSLVRPHLEYAVPAWNPFLSKDIGKLEKAQRRATKSIPELRNLC